MSLKTRILIMRPEEPHETREIELHKHEGSYYADLKALIEDDILGGDYMEHVTVWSDFKGGTDFKYLDMFVNEDGKMLGLPRNEAATMIYRRNVLYHEPGEYEPEQLDFIQGAAVLFEKKVWK